MIAIVHTGGANLASVRNAIERLGRQAELTNDPKAIGAASHVILPGVGAAADAMKRLHAVGLVPVIKNLTQPVLGICLGMQLLFERSQEGNVACLALLPGTVTAVTADAARGITVPHMGWNNLRLQGEAHPLFADITDSTYFYFVHSFQAPFGPFVRATTEHGSEIVAAISHNNFLGVQFHPERSGPAGAALLERFFKL